MKKLATLFTDSWNEFHQVRTITTAAMFGAISVVLGYFTIAIGDYIKIGFSTICNQFVYYLFGPVVGGLFGGALDVLKFLIKPTGAFFPGFTLNAMLGGVLLGIIESLSKAYISSQMADAIVFGVLIIVLLVRPAGILGKQTREKV